MGRLTGTEGLVKKITLELIGAKADDVIQTFGMKVLGRAATSVPTRIVQIEEDDLDHITDQIEQWQVRWRVVG